MVPRDGRSKVKFTVVHNLARETGTITQGDISMGKAVAHLTGTYDAHGKVTSVNLKLNGQNMPVDDLEAMLPAVGVILPPKATLKGGDLDVTMASTGPVNALVTTGTVKMQNTKLANFNLGQKMSAIAALAGQEYRQRHDHSEFQFRCEDGASRGLRRTTSISPCLRSECSREMGPSVPPTNWLSR